MLIRYEMKYNEAFVSAFEDWVQDSYPDDQWLLDKVFNHPTLSDYWEYDSDRVEDMFGIWLNVIYQQKVNPERFKDVVVDYKYQEVCNQKQFH